MACEHTSPEIARLASYLIRKDRRKKVRRGCCIRSRHVTLPVMVLNEAGGQNRAALRRLLCLATFLPAPRWSPLERWEYTASAPEAKVYQLSKHVGSLSASHKTRPSPPRKSSTVWLRY
jgi:hypothetical protein